MGENTYFFVMQISTIAIKKLVPLQALCHVFPDGVLAREDANQFSTGVVHQARHHSPVSFDR